MQQHKQTDNETIYEHGMSVWKYANKLITGDTSDMRLPQWFAEFKEQILKNTFNPSIIEQYCVFHDLGKCFVCTIDENGKRHFPNHENVSADKWLELSSDISDSKHIIAQLIRHDMIFHRDTVEHIKTLKLSKNIICTLLISALASIHANADSFGGQTSDSFKIKFKKLEKRAKQILDDMFTHSYVYVIVRKDLSAAQQAVQSCHAVIEATKAFKIEKHPSVIICHVRSCSKLHDVCAELNETGVKFSTFYEPDIGFELTAIASEPVSGSKRDAFKKFQLLK